MSVVTDDPKKYTGIKDLSSWVDPDQRRPERRVRRHVLVDTGPDGGKRFRPWFTLEEVGDQVHSCLPRH